MHVLFVDFVDEGNVFRVELMVSVVGRKEQRLELVELLHGLVIGIMHAAVFEQVDEELF